MPSWAWALVGLGVGGVVTWFAVMLYIAWQFSKGW